MNEHCTKYLKRSKWSWKPRLAGWHLGAPAMGLACPTQGSQTESVKCCKESFLAVISDAITCCNLFGKNMECSRRVMHCKTGLWTAINRPWNVIHLNFLRVCQCTRHALTFAFTLPECVVLNNVEYIKRTLNKEKQQSMTCSWTGVSFQWPLSLPTGHTT